MIEPPDGRKPGRSMRTSAIADAGIVLSQAHSVTRASNMWPRPTSSIESAITSRLTSEVFMPSLPIVMPSEMAMVLNSMGLAPAARMPALTGTASSRNPKLHGIVSSQQLETPTKGLLRSSGVKPIAYRKDRAAARSRPWYSDRLGRSRGGTNGKFIAAQEAPTANDGLRQKIYPLVSEPSVTTAQKGWREIRTSCSSRLGAVRCGPGCAVAARRQHERGCVGTRICARRGRGHGEHLRHLDHRQHVAGALPQQPGCSELVPVQ